ncbi:hypothetical protein PDE_00438 [Penicillium oxalicum 114-2]|uniref:Uncharacterized protein n=1 Tax=Penicillium oxalicum (strain 114-2 / CGMCC 5302) TaxID=933388 RepID=S7Z4Q8_PENO1|nr:hypothetical protein PDE_00438 [Penicillium oxalicum 114-2]
MDTIMKVTLHDGITEYDIERLKSLVKSAGGQVTGEDDGEVQFRVPDSFDLRLITKNLLVETMSDHP